MNYKLLSEIIDQKTAAEKTIIALKEMKKETCNFKDNDNQKHLIEQIDKEIENKRKLLQELKKKEEYMRSGLKF